MMMDENQRTVEEYQVEEHRTKEISAESRRVKRNYERRDYLLALIMAAASFVYVRGSEFFSGTWLPLFTALFVSAGVFYLPWTQDGQRGENQSVFSDCGSCLVSC